MEFDTALAWAALPIVATIKFYLEWRSDRAYDQLARARVAEIRKVKR